MRRGRRSWCARAMQWLQDTYNTLTAAEETQQTGAQTTDGPQKDGHLSREQLFAFFETASKEMRSEEFRRKLKDARLLKQVSQPLPASFLL